MRRAWRECWEEARLAPGRATRLVVTGTKSSHRRKMTGQLGVGAEDPETWLGNLNSVDWQSDTIEGLAYGARESESCCGKIPLEVGARKIKARKDELSSRLKYLRIV